MSNFTVIEGSFGKNLNKEAEEDNALVIEQLEKMLATAKQRKIISFGIAAVTDDDSVITQFVPARPRNVFTLFGALQHVALRLWNDCCEK